MKRNLFNLTLGLFLCGLAALGGGCLSRPSLQKQMFALRPPGGGGAAQGNAAVGLVRLTLDPLLTGRALLYRVGEHEYESDPYAEWMLDPRDMLEGAVREHLSSVKLKAGQSPQGVQIHVTAFHADFRGEKPAAVVALECRSASCEIRCQREIELGEGLKKAHSAESVVAALDRALAASVIQAATDVRDGMKETRPQD